MNRVQRARGINQIMTGVFYLIAVFFFTLLIGFASYVIIKGFTGATPDCCWIVWISGISCVFRTWKKSSRRSIISFHSGDPSYHNNDRGRNQWSAGTLPAGKSWTWSNKMAVHLSCVDPGVYPKNHDRCHPGSRKRIW